MSMISIFDSQCIHRFLNSIILQKVFHYMNNYAIFLDEMFSDDQKKKIDALKYIPSIAKRIGPSRVAHQLVPLFNQFIDEDPIVVLTLLDQINHFDEYTGGQGTDCCLIPFLIRCCGMDEQQIAVQALRIIDKSLMNNLGLYVSTIESLLSSETKTSIQCGLILISQAIKKIPNLEHKFIQIFKEHLQHEVPGIRIIAAKALTDFVRLSRNREQMTDLLDIIYQDSQDLPKLLTIEGLLLLYTVNSMFVINKIKILKFSGNWRFEIKLCQSAALFHQILSKQHFKMVLEPYYIQILKSQDSEVKQVNFKTIPIVASNMGEQEIIKKMLPIIQKIAYQEEVNPQFGQFIVRILIYLNKGAINTRFLPLLIYLLQKNNIQLSSGILAEFGQLSRHLQPDTFQSNIIQPIKQQIHKAPWRLKIKILIIIGEIIVKQKYLSPNILEILFTEMNGRIEATRKKSAELFTHLIDDKQEDWCRTKIIPKIRFISSHPNYLVRKQSLLIIEQTIDRVQGGLKKQYLAILDRLVLDRTPNIRLMAIRTIRSKKIKIAESTLKKIQQDQDMQIRQASRF